DGAEFREPDEPSPPRFADPEEVVWIDDALPDGARQTGPWNFEGDGAPVYSGQVAHRQSAEGVDQHFFDKAKPPLEIAADDVLFAYVWLDPDDPPKQIMMQWFTRTWDQRAYWGENNIDWGKDGSPSRRRIGDLPEAGQWTRLEVKASEVGLKPGAKVSGWAFTQFGGTVRWDKAGKVSPNDKVPLFDSIAGWIAHELQLEKPTAPAKVLEIIRKEPGKRTDGEERRLREHFIEHVFAGTRGQFRKLHEEKASLERQIAAIGKKLTTTLVWKERAEPKPAYILERGEYDHKGEEVSRSLPEFLPPLPAGAPNDRLGLAQWLLDPAHPLFARVTVNRFWQQVFGTGIVKTAEDFGLQGEQPSHPELLDWLAVRYRELGWDTKELMKLLVTSATYRQDATVTAEKLARDPGNRLVARGPRFRLDAETLRDQALSVSGLLVEKLGGPGVKPPQPDGLWKTVGYSGSNTVKFTADTGPEKVHRRSIYTFWKRTAPPPQMSIADAPPRESCVVRRERTNTPLQALMFMNDPQYFETARHLAERALGHGSGDARERLGFLFECAVARPPQADELAILHETYLDHAREFAADPERARKTVTVGEFPPPEDLDPAELATWTMLASLVMNLDEFLNK
ncbi:MAG: DUF1553 domain-containing protein, partial [Akkermansiaceae bacterium]|nr:DUF1553 domain-containing protein [Akkermansiaceae bacterium]